MCCEIGRKRQKYLFAGLTLDVDLFRALCVLVEFFPAFRDGIRNELIRRYMILQLRFDFRFFRFF